MVETARIFQNIFAVVFRKRRTGFERCQIEKTDIRESPRLIFSGRLRQAIRIVSMLRVADRETNREIAQLGRAGENRVRIWRLLG